ncbi:RNA-binding protein, putative [Hepatocystis sp. ex Piliocolobus tephrosceles]|nr:RNA-binding protein, putative [Hepatocystis sp. ex Piliocolobus tephrosceles]
MFLKMLKKKECIVYLFNNFHNTNKYIMPSCINKTLHFNSIRNFSEYHEIQEEKVNLPRLKLRGLPFDVSEKEIKIFFKDFKLADEKNSIYLIKGIKNNPTGQAYVYFDNEIEAKNACQQLNRKFMRNRYIEIYLDYVFNHNLAPVKEHVTTLMRDRYKKDNR